MRVFLAPSVALLLLACSGAATPTPPAATPAPAPTTYNPSFDCAKASTETEKRVCASESLSALDRELAAAWKTATEKNAAQKAELVKSQKEWLSGNAACKDDTCLLGRYQERIGFLRGIAADLGRPSVTGHYSMDYSSISVLQSQDNTLQFAIQAVRMITPENVHLGTAAGKTKLVGNKATYTIKDYGAPCTFTFTFAGEALTLDQSGSDADCGFGMGVYAGGSYTRKDTNPPSPDQLSGEP